jgi:CRISPR-associated protein Csd1
VRWELELDRTGKLLGITALTGSGKHPERGKLLYVPALTKMRTVAVIARPLCDNGQYVLGLVGEGKKPERAADCHQLFKELVATCAAATGAEEVRAVAGFLEQFDLDTFRAKPNGADVTADHTITFSVEGVRPIDLPSVRAWWVNQSAEGASQQGVCLVTGREGPVVERLPQPIKGIPGGQVAGMPLISMNARAFESYGQSASFNAPISLDAAERCGKALNWLLASDSQRIRIGPLAYVFWTRDAADSGFSIFFDKPDPAHVKQLYEAARTGNAHAGGVVEENRFYAVGLSASGSRVVVRDWLDTSLTVARQSLARWFDCQEMCDPFGAEGLPLGIYALAASLYRDAGKEMTANVPQALLRCALFGGTLPDQLAALAVRRCIAMQGFPEKDGKERAASATRARLLKTWLASGPHIKELSILENAMTELELRLTTPAYLCGRLLCVLEAAQRAALGKVNATLVDRFYGTASSAPASVFGTLLKEAQAHLSKLRKNRSGTYAALTQRLEEIMAPLEGGFPRTLTLKEQALFALGYYHQRAADRAQAKARAELKELDPDSETIPEETN